MSTDNLACFGIGAITYAPTRNYFLVVFQCFEGDNEAYLFRADGSGKTRVTGKWDYINYSDYQWAADGLSFTYQRINSCCLSADQIPASAPPQGIVRYEVISGVKVLVATPTPPADFFRVINMQSNDVLNVRSGAGVNYPIVGTIPYNGTAIRITGQGVGVGQSTWFPIQYNELTGWVNGGYLVKQSQP
jgi:hypothetical protein